MCHRVVERNIDLCFDCEQDLPWITTSCQTCGAPLPFDIAACAGCLKKPPAFDQLFAVFRYAFPIIHLIGQLKFYQRLGGSRVLGELMVQRMKNLPRPQCLIPVPLHSKRLKERGFNQAFEIAIPLAKQLGIPIDRWCCVRSRYTQPQTKILARKRQQNIKNAFQVIKKMSVHHVAIIDDVVTTGHTVSELARVLRKAGVQKIDVWCCAKTCCGEKK